MIVFICFLLSTFVSLWSLRLMAAQNMQELSKSLAARIYDNISGELSEPIVASQTMAHDLFLRELLEGEADSDEAGFIAHMQRYLSDIREGLGFESAYVVSAVSHKYYSYNGLNKVIDWENDERDRWYADFLEQNADYGVQADADEVSQDAWTVFVDSRITGEGGELLGVCGVGVQMLGSRALFADLERQNSARICLVNDDRVIQVSTEEGSLGTEYPFDVKTSRDDEYVYEKLSGDRVVVTRFIDNLGWFLVVESRASSIRSQFISVILLNIVLCAVVMVILLLSIRIIANSNRALHHASFRDESTQLLNRRAFEEEKEQLLDRTLDEDFVYITADINGLKAANDTLGHEAGDELIIAAAKCLTDCFGQYGSIYRIGGDEFVAMLHISWEKLEAAITKFEETVEQWKGEKNDSLAVSCGYALAREHPSVNITELARISDGMMYTAKENYYWATGKDRRR